MIQHAAVPARTALRALGVKDEAELARLLSPAFDADSVELQSVSIDEVPYDLEAITTRCRKRVTGSAIADGALRRFSIFVKVVQSWALSPAFQFVPPEFQQMAELTLPWQVEPAAYETALAAAIPSGLRMPRVYAVRWIDDRSAAIWLEDIDAADTTWSLEHFQRAARLLGRFAASPPVRAAIAPLDRWITDRSVREYVDGRVVMAIIPALRGDDVWAHPAVASSFDPELRRRTLNLVDELPSLLDELDQLPAGICHGDACTRNLLLSKSHSDLVMIDFGFLRYAPLGMDLSQLILGEIQLGERDPDQLDSITSAALTAYVDGVQLEGGTATIDQVGRALAITMAIFSGVSAIPFELLDGPPSEHVRQVFAARAQVAGFILDRLGL